MDARAILSVVIVLVIAAIVLTTTTWEIEVDEPYYTSEPYNYEQTLVREKQVIRWPWFWQTTTQGQYLVNNNEGIDGIFTLNFLFDNGTNSKTETKKVEILAGEEKAVSIESPLAGVSTISLNVVPPNKSELQYRTVKKKVTTWQYLSGLMFLLK